MARTALTVKSNRAKARVAHEKSLGKAPTYSTRIYNRCKLCSRVKGYMRRFEICRICFRELANDGKIMGVTKSSW
jgi:small subunit ribosomal protein S14